MWRPRCRAMSILRSGGRSGVTTPQAEPTFDAGPCRKPPGEEANHDVNSDLMRHAQQTFCLTIQNVPTHLWKLQHAGHVTCEPAKAGPDELSLCMATGEHWGQRDMLRAMSRRS